MEQRKWLARAEKEGWSVSDLRRELSYKEAGIRETKRLVAAKREKLASVLYADPPWSYSNSGFEDSAKSKYPTMTTEDICSMAVGGIVADDAALFLWVTNPLLSDGLEVMESWGFEYKTCFVWVKDRSTGMGFYCRGQHELLLLGTRGSFVPKGVKLPSSVITAKRREHSRKPNEAYDLIEGLYPRFIPTMRELFCRGARRSGWMEPFGNQAEAKMDKVKTVTTWKEAYEWIREGDTMSPLAKRYRASARRGKILLTKEEGKQRHIARLVEDDTVKFVDNESEDYCFESCFGRR